MELTEVMRTAFSAREFTDQPVTDEVLYRLMEVARFAPNGGNRQGWQVVIVRDRATQETLACAGEPGARRYAAQRAAGEGPWNSVAPPSISAEAIAATPVPAGLVQPLIDAPVLLVVCVDLSVVASTDQHLDRVGIISGASIYPFAWNLLLAARNEGLGGTITTIAISDEPALKRTLDIPDHVAVCALIPLGYPKRRITKLRREPVETFTHLGRWGGGSLTASR
ncbi:MAG: nitroreductase family protein [Chloroflexi bacterium]|nr:nitroreductase family protein [Chloroflexota bacterium]MDA1003106.1 nitroreductase family protein [Chloroflexota bacterium]